MLQLSLTRALFRFAFSAPLLLLVACQGGAKTGLDASHPAGTVHPTTPEAPSNDHAVEEHLAQYIHSTGLVEGCQHVQLDLENRTHATLAFSYRVEWLNRQGELVVDREAVWTSRVLGAGERMPLEITAPHPRAESWRLRAVSAAETR
ncbi:MAG: hypothetical protein ACI9F9_000553 [Candidatus Paceibacteria bacterium]|jgi:uncharacterized protein YcfL